MPVLKMYLEKKSFQIGLPGLFPDSVGTIWLSRIGRGRGDMAITFVFGIHIQLEGIRFYLD